MSHSADYHDYVFKDGHFVGKFEDMYRNSSDIPWHQDKLAYLIFSEIDIAILKQFKYDSICEIGCGLGYFTNRLKKELSSSSGENPDVTGIDISLTAVRKANKMFPEIRFIQGDLLDKVPLSDEHYDLVVIKNVLWYVSQNLSTFLQNVVDMVKSGGFLFVSQSFPETKEWVGQGVVDSPETLKEILSKYSDPVYICVEIDWNFNKRPVVHFLGKVKRYEYNNAKSGIILTT